MAYKSNIANLMDSIYARNPLPKSRKPRLKAGQRLKRDVATKLSRAIEKKINRSVRQKSNVNATTTNKQTTPSAKLKKAISNYEANVEQDAKMLASHAYAKLQIIRAKYSSEIKQHGEQTTIPEGFVYLVTHPLFEGWVKAGMTIDFEQRLINYNISDPLSRFIYSAVGWVSTRRRAERDLLKMLAASASQRNGEWFVIDPEIALKIFDGIVASPQTLRPLIRKRKIFF